jgi:C-terminal processing protease CtpA/Prc
MNGLCADGYSRTFKYFVLNSGAFSNIYSDTFGWQESINFKIRNSTGEKSVMIRTISGRRAIKQALLSIPKMMSDQPMNQGFATLKINSFSNFIPQGYNHFFGNLKLKGVRTLILDLRNNTGGEQSVVTDLFSYLISRPSYVAIVPKTILDDPKKTPLESMKIGIQSKVVQNKNAFNGKLYVLLNGGSFSATTVLAASLQALDSNIVIVGEESGGGRAGCTAGSFRTVELKNSNLSLRYGNIPIKSVIEGDTKGRGVIPDALIKYSIDDYIAKRDLEVEWVIKNLPKN